MADSRWERVEGGIEPVADRERRGTHVRSREVFAVPTATEAATILSLPAVLLFVYLVFQSVFDAWVRFGYLREPVAARAPATQVAPGPLTAHADVWHEVTRVSHALIHQPSGTHTHVVGNVLLVALLSWALLVVLTVLGRRSLFVFAYWELVVVAPIVGSFAFDLFGETPHGYGASTIGFAFLGVVAVASLVVLCDTVSAGRLRRSVSTPITRRDRGARTAAVFAGALFLSATSIIAFDCVAASPATPVHQAGALFGAVVGVVLTLSGDRLLGIVAG